jgi:hypothetical protein
MAQNDLILLEYDDGDDDLQFDLNQTDSGTASAHSVEAYTDPDGTLHETSKDAGLIIYGQRS